MRRLRLAPRTLPQRLCLYIGAATCTVLAATAWLDYTASRAALEEQTDAEARKQVQAAAQDLDDFVSKVAILPYSIAARQKALGAQPGQVGHPDEAAAAREEARRPLKARIVLALGGEPVDQDERRAAADLEPGGVHVIASRQQRQAPSAASGLPGRPVGAGPGLWSILLGAGLRDAADRW